MRKSSQTFYGLIERLRVAQELYRETRNEEIRRRTSITDTAKRGRSSKWQRAGQISRRTDSHWGRRAHEWRPHRQPRHRMSQWMQDASNPTGSLYERPHVQGTCYRWHDNSVLRIGCQLRLTVSTESEYSAVFVERYPEK